VIVAQFRHKCALDCALHGKLQSASLRESRSTARRERRKASEAILARRAAPLRDEFPTPRTPADNFFRLIESFGAWPMSKNALPMTVTTGASLSVSFLVERMCKGSPSASN
jgi:hypothetical protein